MITPVAVASATAFTMSSRQTTYVVIYCFMRLCHASYRRRFQHATACHTGDNTTNGDILPPARLQQKESLFVPSEKGDGTRFHECQLMPFSIAQTTSHAIFPPAAHSLATRRYMIFIGFFQVGQRFYIDATVATSSSLITHVPQCSAYFGDYARCHGARR